MKKTKTNQQTVYWRVNDKIHAPKVRVVGADGKLIGLMPTEKALQKAREEELDLVEIAPMAKPPVAKIVDLGKFKYEQDKKLQKQKKKTKAGDVKEVRFSPFIADHDFESRLSKIKEFLAEKHKIRVVVKFKGRQMGSKQFGYGIIKKLLGVLGENVAVDMEPKFIGRHLTCVISPVSSKKKKVEEKKEKKDAKTKDKKISNKKV